MDAERKKQIEALRKRIEREKTILDTDDFIETRNILDECLDIFDSHPPSPESELVSYVRVMQDTLRALTMKMKHGMSIDSAVTIIESEIEHAEQALAALDSIKEDGEENKDPLEFLRAKVREHRQAYALDIFVNSEVITAQSSIDSISANMGRHMCDCFLRYIDEAAKEHEG